MVPLLYSIRIAGIATTEAAESFAYIFTYINKFNVGYRINFLKYQPVPVPLDHLKHSEVFKLVHDLEPAPRGIPARSGKAHAEEDYYNQVSNINLQSTCILV